MLNALVVASVCASPFVDAQGRFSLELPDQWQFAPQPGDTAGAVFMRKSDDRLAIASVSVVPARNQDPTMFAESLISVVRDQPKFNVLSRAAATLGGQPAARRRYAFALDVEGRTVKVAEDRVVVVGALALSVHVETLQATDGFFASDFEHIFETARLGGDAPPAIPLTKLMGRWRMKDTTDVFLELRADGSFDLVGTAGTYRVDGTRLVMRQNTGPAEGFDIRFEGTDMVLSNLDLGDPIRYERADESKVSKKKGKRAKTK